MTKIYKLIGYPKVQDANNVLPQKARYIIGEYRTLEEAVFSKLEAQNTDQWQNIEIVAPVEYRIELA